MIMGIGYLGARMMWDARWRDVGFDNVLTLGHQSLHLFPAEARYFRNAYRDMLGTAAPATADHHWDDYVDDFLRGYLGAQSVTVLDASAYEGAEAIHDMNYPVPRAWHDRYDVIIDGGSLEHIFNVPVAFSNLANMLKVGGTIFINTPANNMMGHGFYQFSPELMFRIFAEANGFALRDVLLYEARYPGVELTKKDTVYKVVDPEGVRQRVGLLNSKPVIMMVEARKIRDAEMFATPPLQSDYVATWNSGGGDGSAPPSWRRRVKQTFRSLPMGVRGPIQGIRQKRAFSLKNETCYTRERWLP
ncbi:SAM-dependent methyltransferase [Mycolicibacterium cosmeticum]|nr:SAM-dependent methyltransferase [Mycolicibacterium cosmeticum]TLH67471.1 SAM-dependent methyltransferase [Mycolicibacterium cosmeticum]